MSVHDDSDQVAADIHDDSDEVAAGAPAQPFKTEPSQLPSMFYTRTAETGLGRNMSRLCQTVLLLGGWVAWRNALY